MFARHREPKLDPAIRIDRFENPTENGQVALGDRPLLLGEDARVKLQANSIVYGEATKLVELVRRELPVERRPCFSGVQAFASGRIGEEARHGQLKMPAHD